MTGAMRSVAVLGLLAAAALAAAQLTPQREQGSADLRLEDLIPLQFGEWELDPQSTGMQVLLVADLAGDAQAAQDAAYDDVLMRTYRRADGARVMLALAYGRRQTQEVKIHRPELCYYAQGFEVSPLGDKLVRLDDKDHVQSRALLTRNRARIEVVTYWIRVGENVTSSPWDLRWTIFREGLNGRVPDGVLVRASSLAQSAEDAESELALQHAFLNDLYREVPAATRAFLAGSREAAT
jgi:EpsI family protein